MKVKHKTGRLHPSSHLRIPVGFGVLRSLGLPLLGQCRSQDRGSTPWVSSLYIQGVVCMDMPSGSLQLPRCCLPLCPTALAFVVNPQCQLMSHLCATPTALTACSKTAWVVPATALCLWLLYLQQVSLLWVWPSPGYSSGPLAFFCHPSVLGIGVSSPLGLLPFDTLLEFNKRNEVTGCSSSRV